MSKKFLWSKSKSAQNSVDIPSSAQLSPVPSGKETIGRRNMRAADEQALAVNNDTGAQRFQPAPGQQSPIQQQIPLDASQKHFKQQFPQRTTSQAQRMSTPIDQVPQPYQQQPQGQQQQPQLQQPQQQQQGPPQSLPAIDPNHRVSYQPQPSPPAYIPVPEAKKPSLRHRIAAGFKGEKDDEQKNGIGRHQSLRESDPRLQEYPAQEANRLRAAQQWHRLGSSQTLPASVEQDETHLDPYLQQDGHENPKVPPKDIQYQQVPPQQQQFVHQDQFSRPPLGRVSTKGSYQTQGGVDHYSPDQHQGQGLQQQQQQQQQQNSPQHPQQVYQGYQPPSHHPQNSSEYQAFNPQNAQGLQGNGQLQNQGQSIQQQIYYQYQTNQGKQAQSPHDSLSQGHLYQQQQQPQQTQQPQPQGHQQQQQLVPNSQSHEGQDYQQLQGSQNIQPPTLQQPEPQQPHTVRQVPGILEQGQQIDSLQLQQIRPSSAQRSNPPPSPLQTPSYQPYNAQQTQPSTQPDESSQNVPPFSQEQDNMAPSGSGSVRNTLRKVPDVGQQPPGPSREPSLLQQPPTQVSQSQRQGQQPQQGSDMGRATPPPRVSVSEMSDEEIEKMIKEHEVLREKYQKVKRYFFEQQTQVHQLQNTLANQRLSLSRTSWDDSEYATRFSRLDGLIAQVSYSIRKDWKTVPQWLHVAVNKTAVETGKQEMTAVGRALISQWIVENIFEKHFHPDLEPGLSTQLQMIALNIRRLAPISHSAEDEDALAAKLINWRLATLEGLSDLMRSPQAATNRQHLIDTFNESLIGSLQMHLNDPAPPDLNGGVPMIIELAISIAQHMPLESREVHVEYFPPGYGIVPDLMKLESGVPALTVPIAEPEEADHVSIQSFASRAQDDSASLNEQDQQSNAQNPQSKDDKKRGMFNFGSMKKPGGPPTLVNKRESGSQQSLTQNPPGSSNGPKEDTLAPRVRMAVGVAVQIRGKSILIKAPVYST